MRSRKKTIPHRYQQVDPKAPLIACILLADPICTSASDIKKKTLSQHKVRISAQDRTLDSMFPVTNPARISGVYTPSADPPPNVSKSKDIKESECYLTSVQNLRESTAKSKHHREFR